MQTKPDVSDKIIVMNPRDELPSEIRQITATRLMAIMEQAENGDTRELFALYRDIVASDNQIQSEFAKRKSSVIGDTVNMAPWDKKNADDVYSKNFCWNLVDEDAFRDAMNWLLNATLWPVSVAEKVYRFAGGRYELAAVVPVHYQLLDFRNGTLRIFDVDAEGRPQPTSHDPDPARYIVHRGHLLPIPDQWGGPMRSILFWWLLRTMSRQWWADLLERWGVPFLKGKYSDDAGRAVLERAFHMAVRLGAIVVSKGTEVEVVQATAGDSSSSHENFIELCNREISKLIVGQTLSSNVQATGMGEGTANLHGSVRDDLRKMDARLLAISMRKQLLKPYLDVNGISGRAPVLLFGSDSASELAAMMGLIKGLGEAGFEPDDDGMTSLAERVGFGIRRKSLAPMPTPFSAVSLSAQVEDQVSPSAAPDLASAFRGRLAPVAEIIRRSASPADCRREVEAWALSVSPGDASDIISQALSAFALSGIQAAVK